jgi:hypothetical protein
VRRSQRIACACVVGSAGVIASSSVSGCYTHQCDASTRTFVVSDGGGLIDDNTFETSPVDGAWLAYPGNAVIRISYPMDMGRPMDWFISYVGISEHPNEAGSNYTIASGGLAEISSSDNAGFSVKNNTCASYFARFVVHFLPRDAGVAADSASADTAQLDSARGEGGVD